MEKEKVVRRGTTQEERDNYYAVEEFWGLTKDEVYNMCVNTEFPGALQIKPDHPLWDCNVDNLKTPREAWADEECIKLAVRNMFYVLAFDTDRGKEPDFVDRHRRAFEAAKGGDTLRLRQLLLQRFTVCRMDGQKVTMLAANTVYKFLKENNIDLFNGVYSPMSGFGGIINGSIKWMKEQYGLSDLEARKKIEAYDINPRFVEYFGFDGVRDVLAQKIETDKVVIACPPWCSLTKSGHGKENWQGTPQEMCDKSFVEWYDLIKEYIKAPAYYIFGPEQGGKKGQTVGLFKKTTGVQCYSDEDITKIKENLI